MHTPSYVNPAPALEEPPVRTFPAPLRFLLLCTLFLLCALWLEPHLAPLCRATALQAAALLEMAGLAPRVHGDLIALSGFTVRIVTDCTPLYPVLLYGALVLAHRSTPWRSAAGLLLGALVITAANAIRIALVAAAGCALTPLAFAVLHVYLGQVIMLLVVLGGSLTWLRIGARTPAPLSFLIRAALWASVLFIPWLLANRSYVALLDHLVALLFSLLYPDYRLLTPRPFAIYNHTFAVPLFLALFLGGPGAWGLRRLALAAGGVCLLGGWHALFRVTHVVWTALDVPEIAPLHQGVYLLGQFLLPFLLWLWLGRDREGKARGGSPRGLPVLVLALVLCTGSTACADSVLKVYSNGRGGFGVAGNNLNRITEAEIRIDYQGEGEGTASASGAGLGAQGSVTVQTDTPGSLTIRLKSRKPMSGSALLATAQIRGTVTFASGWFRDEKGTVETPEVVVTNPTEEQSASKTQRVPAGARAGGVAAARPATAAAAAPVPTASAEPQQAAKAPVQAVTRSRRRSVLELFGSYAGVRTPAALHRLFERGDDIFRQEPPVSVADGATPLTLSVRTTGIEAPRFAISNGNCTRIEAGGDDVWRLEIVPARGSLSTSVTVLSETEEIEFPLAVAPPLASFDATGADAVVAQYVETVNSLAASLGKREAETPATQEP